MGKPEGKRPLGRPMKNSMIVWDLRCSHQCRWRFRSSGMWHVVPSIWKDHYTFICDLLTTS